MLRRSFRQRTIWVISTIILAAFAFIECTNNQAGKPATLIANRFQYNQFAGSQACARCHKDIYDTHLKTAHFHTSEPATEQNVKGSFAEGKNTFHFNLREYIAMEKRNGRMYQVDYLDGKEQMAQPFDIVTGSGKRGQTFMYWEENQLFQMPISYFTSVDQWTNSPGFSNRVTFKRPITVRCLECHSTYFQKTNSYAAESDEFSPTNIVYGVDCEKCHGPGAQHVAFQTKNPDEKLAKFIINPAKMTRQQNLDMCRLCHGGRIMKTKASFTFQTGDTLSNFFEIIKTPPDPHAIDVHGNQYGMLAASKCFQGSQMTCVSCHNPHTNEEKMPAVYSARCMNCHNPEHNNFCKRKNKEKYNIAQNCIDCHMPEKTSRAIMMLIQGEAVPTSATMRSHFITIYPEETKKYLAARHK